MKNYSFLAVMFLFLPPCQELPRRIMNPAKKNSEAAAILSAPCV